MLSLQTSDSNIFNSTERLRDCFLNLPPPQLKIPELQSIFSDQDFFAKIPYPTGRLPREEFFRFTLPDFSESFPLPDFTQFPDVSPNSCLWVINKLKQKKSEHQEKEKENIEPGDQPEEDKYSYDYDFRFEANLKKKFDDYHNLMENAVKNSPGYLVDQLPASEKEKVLKEEWLVAPPLTGICTGLAIEFILQLESGFSDARMYPTSNARYFERLLIPCMLSALHKFQLDNPTELNKNRHFEEVYTQMMGLICPITHLKASLDQIHLPLDQLACTTSNTEGHTLLLLEKEGNGVAEGHMVYINAKTRTIADGAGGVIIHVPAEIDFEDFLDYYLAVCYKGTFNKGSIVSVERDQNFNHVRFPSKLDKAQLAAKIKMATFTDFVAKNLTSNDFEGMGRVTQELFSQTFFPSFRFNS